MSISFGGSGRDDHIVVDGEDLRYPDNRRLAQRAGIGKNTRQSGSGGGFGAYQIHLGVRGAGASLKVPVEGAQGNAARIGGLAHTDAGPAGTFQNTGACGDEVSQGAVFRQHVVHLLGAWGDGQAHVGMDRPCP